ncbi:MAG: DUF6338 family protein [Thiobacillaceae bacterium]|nr:DUF6338 family protein [Thiobacillaceae bacterium]MDW8324419.1 DUF6338 family protein [Burkholderiales bacterium]
MELWHPDKLLLFLAVFLPGFISLKVWDLLVPTEQRDFSKSLFDAIAYSALNFVVLAVLFLPELSRPPTRTHLSAQTVIKLVFVFFVAPMLWPIALKRLLTSKTLTRFIISPIRRPWDYVFGLREPYWIIVHLKDGRAVGGRFDRGSFASSYPIEEQIYVEEVWELDQALQFVRPVERTRGMLIFKQEIRAVEFFSGDKRE